MKNFFKRILLSIVYSAEKAFDFCFGWIDKLVQEDQGLSNQNYQLLLVPTQQNNQDSQQGGKEMKINDFAVKVAEKEGGKKNLSIAQIKEVLKVTNQLLDGQLYKAIKKAE